LTFEETLEQIETNIKRVKVLYDLYFMGNAKRQPIEARRQLDLLARSTSAIALKRYQHRFQLNTMLGRYNAMCELWSKQLRAYEEGRPVPGVGAPSPQRPTPAGPVAAPAETVVFSTLVRNPEAEPDTMQTLYDQYVSARRPEAGRPQIKLESFVRQVTKQAEALRGSSGGGELEFRVLVKGDSVSLKARARK
jgi:hypothetical protein